MTVNYLESASSDFHVLADCIGCAKQRSYCCKHEDDAILKILQTLWSETKLSGPTTICPKGL